MSDENPNEGQETAVPPAGALEVLVGMVRRISGPAGEWQMVCNVPVEEGIMMLNRILEELRTKAAVAAMQQQRVQLVGAGVIPMRGPQGRF